MPYKIAKAKQPGIYKIVNKINGKVYIGQSRHLVGRWYAHKCKEHNPHLARAFNQYGIDNFDFQIIEQFSPDTVTQEILDDAEIKYIKMYNALDPQLGYNIKPGGAHGPIAESTRAKLSAIRGPLHAQYGRIVSDEERKQMAERVRGNKNPMYGRSPSKEICERYSRERRGANNPAARSIICIDTGIIYKTLKEAEESTGIGWTNISATCRHAKNRKTAGGFRWEYYNG